MSIMSDPEVAAQLSSIRYENYKGEFQLPGIIALIDRDLSEPYSVYTYRYFIRGWPELCIMAYSGDEMIGVIVCKADRKNKKQNYRGYIAMLAVQEPFRRFRIGTELVNQALERMKMDGCDEAVLETESSNHRAIALYEKLGFVKDKRLYKYYLNGGDAFRLKLWFRAPSGVESISPTAEPEDDNQDAANSDGHVVSKSDILNTKAQEIVE